MDTVCVPGNGSTDICAATTCNNAAAYFSLPLLSPNHPSKVGQCTPCDGSKCAQRAGSCNECCFQRTCTDFDGLGTDFCSWGYVSAPSTTISSSALAADYSNLYSVFKDTCCKNTPPNSFPSGDGLFAGAVQAQSTQDTNWGFVEDTSNFPKVDNNGRYTGMCFKVGICHGARSRSFSRVGILHSRQPPPPAVHRWHPLLATLQPILDTQHLTCSLLNS